jgi:hypothetical protein
LRERYVGKEPVFSHNAKWYDAPKKDHWYVASADFAKGHLGKGNGRSCLVIGSPLFEAKDLERMGWEVTYLDVRQPSLRFRRFVQADATKIPLPDSSFDAVSTACVLTHAGLGRYGDLVVENGDELMLAEIARLMKPDTVAAVTFGGVVTADLPVRIGNFHRIYTVKEAERMCALVGLKIEDVKIWSTTQLKWVETPTTDLENFDYLSMLLRNVANPDS